MNGPDTNIGKVLSTAECLLSAAGIKSAETEAAILLGFFLDLKRIDLYCQRNEILKPEILSKFKSAVNKRCANFPLQYITGETYFYGLRLIIREGVFIPRPETEILVEKIIKIAEINYLNSLKILELCTGSGNISVSLTKNIQYCTIISSDINTKALDLARDNALRHAVSERINFIQSDLFAVLENNNEYQLASNCFDMIVANPPYVSLEQMNELPADVLKEPKEALYGGNDGLDFYRKIIEQSRDFLKKSGYIAFEFGDKQAKDIEQIIELSKLFDQIEFFADLNGIYRFVIARRING